MKKTAVEILEEQFEKFLAWNIEGDPKAEKFTTDDMWIAFKQALELEKKQIIDAYDASQLQSVELANKVFSRVYPNKCIIDFNPEESEEYYNQTYKKE